MTNANETMIKPGEMWVRQFDMLTERGASARDVVAAMADAMDRIFALATRRVETEAPPALHITTRCPHCGKSIPYRPAPPTPPRAPHGETTP